MPETDFQNPHHDPRPTDEEYLRIINQLWKDKKYVNAFGEAFAELDLQSDFKEALNEGLFQEGEFEKFKLTVRESLDLELGLDGKFIGFLKEMALTVSAGDRASLEPIPVGFLGTKELNAFAMKTPRGGAIIMLNHGLIGNLLLLYRCAMSFITWHSDDPYCRDATQGEYGEALVDLARSLVSNDQRHIAKHAKTFMFPSLGGFHRSSSDMATLMKVFILLHEYGHCVNGHLDKVTLFGEPSDSIEVYSKSEQQEFEADSYAINRLLEYGCSRGMRKTDIALFSGILMRFFDLCEHLAPDLSPSSRTHPPALARWVQIKRYTELETTHGAFAANLDPAFEVIKHEWGNRKGSGHDGLLPKSGVED